MILTIPFYSGPYNPPYERRTVPYTGADIFRLGPFLIAGIRGFVGFYAV